MTTQQELQEAIDSLLIKTCPYLHLIGQELNQVLTALADFQKELEKLHKEHNHLCISSADDQDIIERLEKERDKANERLAKVEKMVCKGSHKSDGWFFKTNPVGPTFLEAIDDLKV